MKLSCLILCLAKAEDISNLATQKSCEQTVMDDDMRYCADRNYSLRNSFNILYCTKIDLFIKNKKSTCVKWIQEQLESRCGPSVGNRLYSCVIVNSANYPTWRTWQASNYRLLLGQCIRALLFFKGT